MSDVGEIKLIDDWVVVVDDLNYALAKKVPVKQKDDGKERREWAYKYYGYYSNLSQALYALCDRVTRDALKAEEPITLKDAVETITRSYDRVSNLLKECLDGR